MNALDPKNQEQIETLLDEQIFTKIEFQEKINDTIGKVVFYFFAGLVLLGLSLVPYYSLPYYMNQQIIRLVLYVSFYICWCVASFFIAESIVRLMRLKAFNLFYQSKFIIFLFKKQHFRMRVIFTFIIFSSLNFLFHRFMGLESVEEKYASFNHLLTKITVTLGLTLFCLFISGTIVDYLDFYSYQMNYKNRVKHNREVLKHIQKINRALPKEITNLGRYAAQLFDTIMHMSRSYNFDSGAESNAYSEVSKKEELNAENENVKTAIHEAENHENKSAEEENPEYEDKPKNPGKEKIERREAKKKKNNRNYLVREDFDRLFNEPEIFSLFDFDRNNQVTRHEFIKRYLALFEERERLKRALEQNSNNMVKINILISSLFVPFIVFILLVFTGHLPSFQNSFTMAGLVIFPFTFAFKSLVEEIFSSVIFVFFIKPFDYGDIFFVEGKRYEVLSIGILYTDFLLDDKFITLKNNFFNAAQIFNLRKSDFISTVYTFKFDYKSFKENEREFTKKLDEYFNDTPSNSYKIGNYSVERTTISVTLEVKNVIPYQEIDTLEERNDEFVLFVNNLIEELNITQM
ncbi:Small Conductance Mechanosensitive Ion Channel (MscS) Family [Trachipleistophora hominis]|uniref:Small Conductance Mechanosensitive Ion Channel (MscS) Family n=1 Tax=Trachipleistophora hominis TaxID=72359 RepID=L7JYJ0_TRAHO|nr:Small Conductance Mechanosensitive Ion Channel (MscS) Family [Trachipleistophora hominis]